MTRGPSAAFFAFINLEERGQNIRKMIGVDSPLRLVQQLPQSRFVLLLFHLLTIRDNLSRAGRADPFACQFLDRRDSPKAPGFLLFGHA